MPARLAATGLKPTARSCSPKTIFASTIPATIATTTVIGSPICSGKEKSPVRSGSLVASGISSDSGNVAELVIGLRSNCGD